MRDRIAFAFLLFVLLAAAGGIWLLTDDLPDENVPDATFEVAGDAESGELIVEHADGESFESESLRVLVYEDRPVIPDRTVHGTIWETETGVIQPGDRIELDDPRFESGQRVVIRWFGDGGQANVYDTTI